MATLKENDLFIIVAGSKRLEAINPRTKQTFQIKLRRDHTPLLDIFANNFGVYHAIEAQQPVRKENYCYTNPNTQKKSFSSRPVMGDVIQIYDSLSGKVITAIKSPQQTPTNIKERLAMDPVSFYFTNMHRDLGYVLEGSQHQLFTFKKDSVHHKRVSNIPSKTNFEEEKVFYDGRKVGHLVGDKVKYVQEVNAFDFARSLRLKNYHRFGTNREMFS